MTNAGNINNNDIVPSLRAGENVILDVPWIFLPPGTTAQRPAPSSTINYRLRFNTDDQLYEYYDAVLGAWTQLQESAFTVGPFVTYTADASLPGAQNLGALSNGILKQTITSGSATLNIAVNGTDYYGPGFTGYLVSPSGIADANNNPILNTVTAGASAVNYIQVSNSLTGSSPFLQAAGSDSNIGILLKTKGISHIQIMADASSTPLVLVPNSGSNSFGGIFSIPTITADRTYTFKDASGTLAFTSDLTGFVTSVSGTLNRITSTGGTTPVIDISASYVGQSSITTLGTVTTGTWNAGAVTSGANPITSGTPTGGNAYFQTYSATSGNGWLQLIAANSSGNFGGVFTNASLSNTRTWTFPDSSGTVALTSQLPAGAALTKTDDTNVTLTLGGSPTTALLAATSLTLGWTGTLSGTRGGTGVNNGSNTATFAGNLNFANAFTTSGNFAVTQTYTGITNVTFPTSGTLATTSQLPSASALTKTDDTNVTLTLGGSPTVALLAATSLTLGWTGQLSLGRGGTNNNLTASAGGIVWSDASKLNILAGTATANQLLLSGNAATPVWSTSTYPTTNAINTLLYASSANVMSALATANSGGLSTNSSGVPAWNTKGTWTPTILFGGASTGVTYSTQFGNYFVMGPMVYITFKIVLTSKGSATGAATIGGLTFNSATGNEIFPMGLIGNTTIHNDNMICQPDSSGNIIHLYYNTTGSGISNYTDADLSNTTQLQGEGFYFLV